MTIYETWLTEPDGTRISLLKPVQLSYTNVYGDIGIAQIQLANFDNTIQERVPDRRINIWRTPNGGTKRKIWSGFVRRWNQQTGSNGAQWLTLIASTAEEMLFRRVIPFTSEAAGALASAEEADDLMKRLVDENIVSASDADRQLSIVSNDEDTTDGSQLDMKFSYKNLLATLKAIQAASKAQSNEVFFALVPNGDNYIFRTWINQPGNDRTQSGNNPLIFGEKWNNLDNLQVVDDWSKEVNFAYAGGQGTEADMNVQSSSDTDRIAISPYNRREGYLTARLETTNNGVTSIARNFLAKNRPKRIVTADILDTPLTPYGTPEGWNTGDKVTLDVYNTRADAIIRSTAVKFVRGKETVKARVETL